MFQGDQVPYPLVILGEVDVSEGLGTDPPRVASVEVVEENVDVPLQTRTVPLEEVKANIKKWRESIEAEHQSLVEKTKAVEPLDEEGFQELCKNHVVELIPGKSVHTVKAYTGRLKTRWVGCGNYQHGEKRTKRDTFSGGIDTHSLRRRWRVGTLDVTTAFLNAEIVTPNQEAIVVKVPAVFRMIGIKEKYWRVHKALYGLDVSPRSWSLSRKRALRQVDQLKPLPQNKAVIKKSSAQDAKLVTTKVSPTSLEPQTPSPREFAASINKLECLSGGIPAKFVQLAEDANVWKVALQDPEGTVVGAIGLYVDDILITGQDEFAELISSTLCQQWKTTRPQWLDQEGLAFHGFEIRQEGSAIILHQENCVAETLSRYQQVEGN